MAQPAPAAVTRRLLLSGRVQGVGFRPFVYRLAHELGLDGFVRNLRGEVEVVLHGPVATIERFAREVIDRAPPLARPMLVGQAAVDAPAEPGFHIASSSAALQPQISVPPDFFCCPDCLTELADPGDRRHRYAFINCTQCGPRYTLIEALPYDRPNTTMRAFPLCDACRNEYEDPLDRRFHAEPVACPVCGPHLEFVGPDAENPGEGDDSALAAAVAVLRDGRVLAVKGIGGYHLLCDARSEAAVARLRERKHRPDKPLAVMYPWRGPDGLDDVRDDFDPEPAARDALLDPARSIVLLGAGSPGGLAPNVAPGLAEVGVFLPYSPLHQLLLGDFGGPLVATSGNVSGEPVLTSATEARERLAGVADAFLHHDRLIARPADDSVVRVIAGRARPIRLGRGIAPLELELPRPVPRPVLAVGGHLKTTVALAWGSRIVVSPHVGDMGTLRSEQVFAQVAADLQHLYDVRAEIVLSDAHPDYATTRWARASGLVHERVQHHRAHASALAVEHGRMDAPAIVFAWDGVGLGDDGTLWGGETFVGTPGQWQRAASLRPFRLPGGDRAGRAPWRSAAAVCWELGRDCPIGVPDPMVRTAWERRMNSPQSSAAGRLFDAASAIILGLGETSFEGQGPMWLEAIALDPVAFPRLELRSAAEGRLDLDWAPLVDWLLQVPPTTAADRADRAGAVHASLADGIVQVAERVRDQSGTAIVGLTGGVFQNRRLTAAALAGLSTRGFEVLLPVQLPCNDGGLSYGQVADFVGRND
ncbi:MAG: carbamoyltransferase HypF [Steroidobacteraceae bacterium]|nr:carbamoyltransferase HypF [Steroidobacteraceae bacterium]MBP7013425.1 carbamoyltransferase HypF [Steroidobacteraceae bacterium]